MIFAVFPNKIYLELFYRIFLLEIFAVAVLNKIFFDIWLLAFDRSWFKENQSYSVLVKKYWKAILVHIEKDLFPTLVFAKFTISREGRGYNLPNDISCFSTLSI